MKNLYRVLGVKKAATPDAIRDAYRKKVLATHPDRGGDAEKFKEVQRAFEVLSDPERRRRYDETGEEAAPVDRAAAEVTKELSEALTAVLGELARSGRRPSERDVVVLLRERLGLLLQELAEVRGKGESAAQAYAEVVARTERKGGPNLVATIAAAKKAAVDRELGRLRAREEVLGKALQELRDYTFRFDRPGPASHGAMWNTVAFPWGGPGR